ncbi:ABC transporter ATP-binding protein [Pediococcus pentosaceus]|uniref:ABC transporter ATP-binding protein n=1 Tax=Pediococcus pentosaceus TaxID=1255 RepID=UPI0020740AD6|nr:ATP-binding cassette domain-containing protein [Pediococcus pentosaceus]MCM6820965.1 ATP-binding cassette domain-containing protein [Pediococcus pentosaceus]
MKIEIKNVEQVFKEKKILKGINTSIDDCSIVGLLGENGAGKTTLMDIVATLEQPTAGIVLYDGKVVKDYQFLRNKIGYMPQEFGMYPQFSVEDNIKYFAYLHNLPNKIIEARVAYLIDTLHLSEHRKKKYKQLSGGMKRRVGLAVALVHAPEILIIDEPTAGVDPEERSSIRDFILQLGESISILFSTHIIEDIEQISDKIIVLKQGNVLFQGEVSQLLKRYEGKIFDVIYSPRLGNVNIKIIKQFKAPSGARAIIYSPKGDLPEGLEGSVVEPTLENCYLILNDLEG